jgi:hypothetical protein
MTDKLHFADLTWITAPFGLLDDDTQERLLEWPHGVELFCVDLAGKCTWSVVRATFAPWQTYRASLEPLVPDSVDWSHVGPAVNWIARDEDGAVWGYAARPMAGDSPWFFRSWAGWRIDGLIPSYRRGTVGWRDSLISRPGVEDGQ